MFQALGNTYYEIGDEVDQKVYDTGLQAEVINAERDSRGDYVYTLRLVLPFGHHEAVDENGEFTEDARIKIWRTNL